ncbi:DUF6907 domain-containing protein [Streptomyces sp. NPDC002755]|uniref:DUF6907 domain-containing protein n=1 Tax=Streptomyces sp. NPDC002884 TaxID=3154544 RepID=UPI0033170C75
MNSRTITVPTLDHGPVTLTCPLWCAGHDSAAQHRTDISHTGPDQPLSLPTARGPVTHLITALEQRPFTPDPLAKHPYLNVCINGDWYPCDPTALHAMADVLTAHAYTLHARAAHLRTLHTRNEQP